MPSSDLNANNSKSTSSIAENQVHCDGRIADRIQFFEDNTTMFFINC